MQPISRFAPWINRWALSASTLVFTMIALRYIVDPVRASAATGVTLAPGLATTVTRIGFGAFPLAVAIFTFSCLFSKRRQAAGVELVAIVMFTAIVVRLISVAMAGATAQSTRLFIPETAILLLSLTGMVLERSRRKLEVPREQRSLKEAA